MLMQTVEECREKTIIRGELYLQEVLLDYVWFRVLHLSEDGFSLGKGNEHRVCHGVIVI